MTSTTPSAPDEQPRTIEEMKRWLRDFQKQERLKRLAQGRAKPRTRREFEIFLEGARRRLGEPDDEGAE